MEGYGCPPTGRAAHGRVGVYDGVLFRFTVFEPSGAYVSEVRVPFLHPLRSFDTVLTGVLWRGWIPGSLMIRYDVNLASGEVVREEASPIGPWGVACEEGFWGIPDRAGGWVFEACEGHLIFVGNTGDATVLRVPTELPDERDVARREEGMLAGQGRMGPEVAARVRQISPDGTYRSLIDQMLEDYRAKPKPYSLGTEQQLVDAANRYWIATQRDTHEWSLPGRVRECRIRRIGAGQRPHQGLRPPGFDFWSTGRSARTMPTGFRTGRWTGTTLGISGWGGEHECYKTDQVGWPGSPTGVLWRSRNIYRS